MSLSSAIDTMFSENLIESVKLDIDDDQNDAYEDSEELVARIVELGVRPKGKGRTEEDVEIHRGKSERSERQRHRDNVMNVARS